MTLTLDEIIKKLKIIEKKFNATKNPTEKYALIQALNHIAEKELPVHGYWEDTWREVMLKEHGANT